MTEKKYLHAFTRSISKGTSRIPSLQLKVFLLCALIAMTTSSLRAQQKDTIKQIDFTKSTRGYEERIRVTPDSVVTRVEDFRADEKVKQSGRKLKAGEWRNVLKTLKHVPLKSIPDLPSLGMKRASDAALQGTLEITTTQQHAYTHTFDDEYPNPKLMPLLKAIKDLVPSGKHY